jgi:hypothetical protein
MPWNSNPFTLGQISESGNQAFVNSGRKSWHSDYPPCSAGTIILIPPRHERDIRGKLIFFNRTRSGKNPKLSLQREAKEGKP